MHSTSFKIRSVVVCALLAISTSYAVAERGVPGLPLPPFPTVSVTPVNPLPPVPTLSVDPVNPLPPVPTVN